MMSATLQAPDTGHRAFEPGFTWREDGFAAEGVPVREIAEAVGTPFYCYSRAALTERYTALESALSAAVDDPMICYAVKANSNLAVLASFAALGAGADIVSEGELFRAIRAGIPADRIVFSGVGKTGAEIRAALKAGVRQINIESETELNVVSDVATALGVTAPVAFRVNPDVDARTHDKISTGRKQDKFGIAMHRIPVVYGLAHQLPGVEPVGVAVHIGSQLLSLDPYRDAFEKMARLVTELRADGHTVTQLDLGGGIGIAYDGEDTIGFEAYAAVVRETVGDLGCHLAFEPGRSLVGNAGVLITRVIYRKDGGLRPILVVDAAMNDLIRPAMYGAHHEILPVATADTDNDGVKWRETDVVGPVCESGDTFATRRRLPPLNPGDLVVFGSAGAYGAVMSSQYNSRLLTPEVLVDGDRFDVVRRRPDYDEMLALEEIPEGITS